MKNQIKLLLVLFFLQCTTSTTLLAQAQLIAWYPFNGNAHDETGNGYNGTVSGATLTDDRFGNPKSAYNFDGINDKIVIGKEPNFPSWNTYAVSLWFLSDGGGTQNFGYGQKILSKAQAYTDFHLGLLTNGFKGTLSWWSAQGGGNSVMDSSQDYRDKKWHHVVLNKKSRWDGDIWVDGILQNSSGTLQAVFNDEDLVIGFTTHSDIYQQIHFSGKVDDIRIYNGALSKSAIWDLFIEGGCNGLTVYADADGDGYGNATDTLFVADCKIPSGYVYDSTDCDDAKASVHPLAREVCNGIDDNCNGLIDEITGLTTTNITATTATLNWKKLPGSKAYGIKYRPVVQSVNPWTVTGAAGSSTGVIISGLQPNTPYVWLIKSHCEGFNTAFSGPVKFKTAAALSAGEQDESIKATGIGLSVYPNPGNGNMTVSLSLPKPQAVFISVSDVAGKEVYASSEGIVSGTFTRQLDLSKLNSGTYFLKLTHDGKREMRKIVVK